MDLERFNGPSWRRIPCVMTDCINSQRHDGLLCASWRKLHKTLWNSKHNYFALSVVTLSCASWRTIKVRRDALFVRHDGEKWISFWISKQNGFALSVVTHLGASWRTDGLRRDAKLCVMTESFESPCFCIVRHDGGFLASWRTSQFFKNAQ